MAQPVVRIESVGKVYQPSEWWMKVLLRTSVREPVVALDDVSFDVEPGTIYAIIGPNGAGKSTLFRILTGLTTPTSGAAFVQDLDCERQSSRVRGLVGFMPAEDHTLWLRHTAQENLEFHGRLQGMREARVQKRVEETLAMVGLEEARTRVGFALSSGMRARLMLARAMFHEPEILILDEPTGPVDPVGSHQLIELIKSLSIEQNIAVLLSSHRLDEVEVLSDSVTLLDRGRAVYHGDVGSMRATYERAHVTIDFDTHQSARTAERILSDLPRVDGVSCEGARLVVASELHPGAILQSLDGRLDSVRAIGRAQGRLQELIARILSDGTDV